MTRCGRCDQVCDHYGTLLSAHGTDLPLHDFPDSLVLLPSRPPILPSTLSPPPSPARRP